MGRACMSFADIPRGMPGQSVPGEFSHLFSGIALEVPAEECRQVESGGDG